MCDRIFSITCASASVVYVEIENKVYLSVQLNDNATSVNKTENAKNIDR